MSGSSSNGGQSTSDLKPSTSKQAKAEQEMDISLPTVDPTKLIYDKGHIMEWLSYSLASVGSVLNTNGKNISDYVTEFADVNMPTLIQEDFRSCRTTQNIVLGVADQIDMTIKQLLRAKNNMLNDLNIYYPGIETVKPAAVHLMTTETQTDLVSKTTTGVQTMITTQQDASWGTDDPVGCDKSTSMDDFEGVLPPAVASSTSVVQEKDAGLELMEVCESEVPEVLADSVPKENVLATSSGEKDLEQLAMRPVAETSITVDVEAVAVQVEAEVLADMPSSPISSEEETSVRQGGNNDLTVPSDCEVTLALDRIPQEVFDYLLTHGSIRIVAPAVADGNDHELESALRSLNNFDADVANRHEIQRKKSGIRKQKRIEQLRNRPGNDDLVRDIDSGDQDRSTHGLLDTLMDADPSSATHEQQGSSDCGTREPNNSEELNLDSDFVVPTPTIQESAARNFLFGAEVPPSSESDAVESQDTRNDPNLANPPADATSGANHIDNASIETEEVRQRNRAYVPNDCIAAHPRDGIDQVEVEDDIEVIDLTQDKRMNPGSSKKRKKRQRSSSGDSGSNPSKRPSHSPEDFVIDIWDSFAEVPSTGTSEVKPDVKPVVDLTVPSPPDDEVQYVEPELIKTFIKMEPGRRKNIRPILQEDALSVGTKRAEQEDKARQQRIERNQEEISTVAASGQLVLDQYNGQPLEVMSLLSEKLKPHQKDGVRFMWNTCFEKVETYLNSKDESAGCVLAHCMGLGKTLTAITFMHTILTFEPLRISRILVLCPSGIVENWMTELGSWLKRGSSQRVRFYNFQKTGKNAHEDRTKCVKEWADSGGIGVMSYSSFRLCFRTAKGADSSKQFLLEGAEQHLLEAAVVICDEGHSLKNKDTQIFKAVQKIKTQRRIILTGTPMQNNLTEYYWMVSFVRPQLLGTPDEFSRQFTNPILNGQMLDSTETDVATMRARSGILFEKLKGTCHRIGVDVLKDLLPPKHEFTLFVKLSEIQKALYNVCPRSQDFNSVMTVYSLLSKILCHPKALFTDPEKLAKGKKKQDTSLDPELLNEIMEVLRLSQGNQEKPMSSQGEIGGQQPTLTTPEHNEMHAPMTVSEGQLPDAVIPLPWYSNVAESEEHLSTSNMPHEHIMNGTTEAAGDVRTTIPVPWWSECLKDVNVDLLDHSSKMVILLQLIQHCVKKREKVLVFSQYVYTLNLVEEFLSKVMPEVLGGPQRWKKGVDYFRMDGTTAKVSREMSNAAFNKTARAKVYLVTSKTGGHGINLIGASRLVLFDSSFNPSNDLQCIYRIYRLGQTKPTYVYRLIGGWETAEHTVYRRQKVKLGISQRVVDDHGTHRCVTKDAYTNNFMSTIGEPQSAEAALVPNYTDEVLNQVIASHGGLLHDIENGDMEHVEDKLSEDELTNAKRQFEKEIEEAAAAAKETAGTPRKGGKKNKKQGPNVPPPATSEQNCVQDSSTQG